jgi:hypothetical protein
MDYLYKHRDNSRKLPFDVMNIIYEYADPFLAVKKQIVNKDYDLEEIMYKRILRFIKDRISRGLEFYIDFYEPITHINMYNKKHKQVMLYDYREYTLYSETYRKRRICGLDIRYEHFLERDKIILEMERDKIIMDLEANGHKVNRRYSTKQLYKKWLKL